jgi:U4/U6.U5 tri-snRNP-associated protein 2
LIKVWSNTCKLVHGEEKEGETEDTPDEPVVEETTTDANFIQLTLGIPQKPIFRDDDGGLVIPQEPLVSVLKKFDGVTFSDALSRSEASQRKRYRLLELPQYLILHLARIATLERRFTQL